MLLLNMLYTKQLTTLLVSSVMDDFLDLRKTILRALVRERARQGAEERVTSAIVEVAVNLFVSVKMFSSNILRVSFC